MVEESSVCMVARTVLGGSCGAVLVWNRSVVLYCCVFLCLGQQHKPVAPRPARPPVCFRPNVCLVGLCISRDGFFPAAVLWLWQTCFLRKPGLRSGWRQ